MMQTIYYYRMSNFRLYSLTREQPPELSSMSSAVCPLRSLLGWVETERLAEQEVMGAQKGNANLINNFCSAGDALLSNADPPVWWHMLIKSAAGCPLHPNLPVSKWIYVCACVPISAACSIYLTLVRSCVCECVWVCMNMHMCPFLFMHVPNMCVHGAVAGTAPNLHINFPHLNKPLIGWWWW